MSSALDMTLDEMIKNNKKSGGGRGGRGRGGGGGDRSGTGPSRRIPNRSNNRSAPYSMGGKPVQAPGDSNWQHDMFTDPVAVAAVAAAAQGGGRSSSAIETGTKLYISNLDYGVSNEDIKELFSEVGDLKRHAVHYDRSGRSKGTAEVVFSRRVDAASAVKRYNNVQLDGKPMKIEIVGTNIESPAFLPVVPNGIYGNLNGAPRGFPGRGRASSRLRGGGGGNGGRGSGSGRGGRGRGRGRSEPPSVSDLDADLEKYHSEAMQIN